jgi:hypothetical protein
MCFIGAIFMIRTKNLNRHPYPLFTLELICIAGMFLTFDLFIKVYKIPYYHLIHIDMIWQPDTWRQKYFFRKSVLNASSVIYFVFFQAYILTVLCIYLDLYLCLHNPFYPRHYRLKWYYTSIVASSIIVFLIQLFALRGYDNFDFFNILGYEMVVIVLCVLYFMLNTIYRLRVHGTSQQLRNTIRRKYIVYFVLLLPYFVRHIFSLLNLFGARDWRYFIWTRVIGDGLMIAQVTVRFMEPYI